MLLIAIEGTRWVKKYIAVKFLALYDELFFFAAEAALIIENLVVIVTFQSLQVKLLVLSLDND